MVTTSFTAVVLSAVLTGGAVSAPAWHSDYAKALSAATAQHKPVAVFIGQGESGYEQIVKGGIPSPAAELLAKKYVCVYVDTATSAGKSLAGQFELKRGLVISTKDGSRQALWHKGEVAPTALTGYLNNCCEASKVVTTTEVRGTVAAVAAPAVRPAAPASYPGLTPQYFPQQFPRSGFPGAPCLTGR
jgi:hypothetical protein